MKNRLPHLIAMLLACLMLLSSVSILAGCAKEDAPDTETASGQNGTAGETSTEYVPDIAKKNYNTTFNVVAIGFNEDLLILDEDKKRDGNSLDEAVYERGVLVKEQLGVECEFADAGDWISYSGKIANTVQTGDDAYQLVLTHVYQGVTDLVTSNSLMNFTDLPSVNLDAPYWNRNLMESLKVDDRYLLGYSDFCLSSTHCVVFNKDMLQNYRLEDPYALVNNKKWTVDKLFSLASAVSEDNGDGKWTVDDYYGISGWGWVPLITFITSCDMKIVDRDEDTGRYYVAYEDNTEKMLSLIDKVTTMYKANYSYMWPSVNYTALKFAEGHSLFQLYSTTGLISLATEKIRFGVLPYPKFDEKQEKYRSLNWNGLMGVPASVNKAGNPQMVGEVLELLGYYTGTVKTAYYELQLGAKVSEAQEDADMLDIIWKSLVSDIGLVCCNCSGSMDNLVYMLPMICESPKKNFSSFMRSNKSSAQKGLDKVFKQ